MIDEYFFRQTPEVEKARETWENYKKDYQTSYENMQVKMFFVRFFCGFLSSFMVFQERYL